jgi:phosphotransferase family enzyme
MMLDIVPLVDALLPGLLQGARPSVACVCTTRPKYLVFGRNSTRPVCVVEFGDELRLTRTDQILSTLQSRMPGGSVPVSLCCTEWRNGTYVHIQQGLAGAPWFRLTDALKTPAAWEALLGRAVAVMDRLHEATRAVPAWRGPVNVAAELERQAATCRRNGTRLSDKVVRRVEEWSERLDHGMGSISAWWQHGDFSLNNLLVSAASMAIIDFEEFGGTLVPLHDAFGLALSVTLSQDGRGSLSRARCLAMCAQHSLTDGAIDPAHLAPLLMHHVLWRINHCHGLDRRAALQHTLLGWAADLADAPDTFFADIVSPVVG